jgi:hypothetical protein
MDRSIEIDESRTVIFVLFSFDFDLAHNYPIRSSQRDGEGKEGDLKKEKKKKKKRLYIDRSVRQKKKIKGSPSRGSKWALSIRSLVQSPLQGGGGD